MQSCSAQCEAGPAAVDDNLGLQHVTRSIARKEEHAAAICSGISMRPSGTCPPTPAQCNLQIRSYSCCRAGSIVALTAVVM
jgi:hypothetical protein